jgi:broad specificity phosphatase PhoE
VTQPPPNEPPAGDSWLMMVRHTAVDPQLKGICYGASDVELSAGGLAHIEPLADALADKAPSIIVHSGLRRSRMLAEAVAGRLGLEPCIDPRIAEFNFGEWELRGWAEIFAAGHDIARLIHEPDRFAAPGGETLFAMRDRVLAWYKSLPSGSRILAVSHGGPISTLRGILADIPPAKWPDLAPQYGEHIRFALRDETSLS